MNNGWRVAVAGATGVLGEALLKVLGERDLKLVELHALCSEASIGRSVEYRNAEHGLAGLERFDFGQVDVALLALPEGVAGPVARRAAEAGTLVVDASRCFVGDDEVPSVAAALDLTPLNDLGQGRIVRTPAASALVLARALRPLAGAAGLEAVRCTACLAVSGAGRAGIDELAAQCTQLLNGRPVPLPGPAFAARVAFNCLPTAGALGEQGLTDHEQWVTEDLARLLGLAPVAIRYRAVVVPAFYGDGYWLEATTQEPLSPLEFTARLKATSGLEVEVGHAPTPAVDAAGTDLVCVGRLSSAAGAVREHHFWVAADALRQAAANSVTLVEVLAREHF
jgi:aspartate-semialdehyde dehydrogenase